MDIRSKKIQVGDWYFRLDGKNTAEVIKEEQSVEKKKGSVQGMEHSCPCVSLSHEGANAGARIR